MSMSRIKVTSNLLKNGEEFSRYSCCHCASLLENPVQLGCGHRLCKSCADELVASTAKCPECKEDIEEEDGVKVSIKIIHNIMRIIR